MLELYHNAMSVCAQKVRIVLAEKGINYRGHALDIRAGETHTPQYRALNPKGVVPTLVVDGMPMGRNMRPFFAWYGAMELVDHLWTAMGIGRTTIVVEFHDIVTFARFGSRKALTQHCEQVIGRALAEINAGRRPSVSAK